VFRERPCNAARRPGCPQDCRTAPKALTDRIVPQRPLLRLYSKCATVTKLLKSCDEYCERQPERI
jgi:hypothetical protein